MDTKTKLMLGAAGVGLVVLVTLVGRVSAPKSEAVSPDSQALLAHRAVLAQTAATIAINRDNTTSATNIAALNMLSSVYARTQDAMAQNAQILSGVIGIRQKTV